MAPPDVTAAKRPKFSGEPALWATFLTRFVGYALLNIKGVDSLHALEDDDKTTWYPVHEHTGTGKAYRYEPDEEVAFDDVYNANVAVAACPAYPDATDAAARRKARTDDKRARRLLMAALRDAVDECSTAKQRLAYADPNDGVSGLLVLDARYGTTKAAANRHVKLKKLLWQEDYGTGTISQFLERIDQRINNCIDAGVELTETDKYGAVISGLETSDPTFAGQVQGVLAMTSEQNKGDPYGFITAHLLDDFPDRCAEGSYTALLARVEAMRNCQICGSDTHVAANCKKRTASATTQKRKFDKLKSQQPSSKKAWQERIRANLEAKKKAGTYVPTPEWNRRRRWVNDSKGRCQNTARKLWP